MADKARLILGCVSGRQHRIKTIAIMEDFDSELTAQAQQIGIEILSMKELEVLKTHTLNTLVTRYLVVLYWYCINSLFLQAIGKANHKTPIVSKTESCIDSLTVRNNDLFNSYSIMSHGFYAEFLFTSSLLNQKILLLFALPVELPVSVHIYVYPIHNASQYISLSDVTSLFPVRLWQYLYDPHRE